MDKILQNYPASSTNNARSIVRGMMERMKDKPSYGLQKKLEKMGIGVQYSTHYGEDTSEVEEFHLIDREEIEEVSDDSLVF